ncbi:MAG TPA: hypothetical protein VHG92_08505 [Afifellaceae bacterium]|nr:hypothetical protein [Afifellaceae bacterium]
MKFVRHTLFIFLVALSADAAVNDGKEVRALQRTVSPSNVLAQAKLAGYHIREELGRAIPRR